MKDLSAQEQSLLAGSHWGSLGAKVVIGGKMERKLTTLGKEGEIEGREMSSPYTAGIDETCKELKIRPLVVFFKINVFTEKESFNICLMEQILWYLY